MKRNVVLLTSCELDLAHPADVPHGKTDQTQRTFDVLNLKLDDIDLAIVDLGATSHSLGIVEALTHSEPAPRVIALLDAKDAEAIPELQRCGAAACLKKPFCADELARLIEFVCRSAGKPGPDSTSGSR